MIISESKLIYLIAPIWKNKKRKLDNWSVKDVSIDVTTKLKILMKKPLMTL